MADKPKMTKEEAHAAGRAARIAGKGVEAMAQGFRITKSYAAEWRRGWDEGGAPPVETRPIDVVARVPRVETRAAGTPWPDGKPLPQKYVRPPVPCPTCRLLLDRDGGRAAVVKAIDGDTAYFRCRATKGCPDWKLPIER